MLEDVPVHGDELGPKNDSNIRIFFENIDGFGIDKRSPAYNDNKKIEYFNSLMSHLNADIYGGVETRTNWSMLPGTHNIERVLDLREGNCTITAHNEHEQFSIAQQGGTFLVATTEAAELVCKKGKDPTGLGRWCWLKLSGTTSTTE